MVETRQKPEPNEAEISLLEEWLPKVRGEHRAYLKGAARALFFVQEHLDISPCPDNKQEVSL